MNDRKRRNVKNESKRDFIKQTAAVALTAISSNAMANEKDWPQKKIRGHFFEPIKRAQEARSIKQNSSQRFFRESLKSSYQHINFDEYRYADEHFYASFTKTLPSNQYGEVKPFAFKKLIKAFKTSRESDFDAIPLDDQADRKLANPQGALKYTHSGLDGHATRIKKSHTFRSAELAAEAAEVYWQSITRDIPFIDYGNNALIDAAVTDLNRMTAKPASIQGGSWRYDTLFRGETAGDLIGPYISQFLLKDFRFGPLEIVQRYDAPIENYNYMTTVHDWLSIQKGSMPTEGLSLDQTKRYIYNGRTLGEYVHQDVSFQAYLNAALILLSYGGSAIDDSNPYKNNITNQGSFTSLGAPFILDLVTRAANLSLNGAWFQKWQAHRLLRPEAYGARVHFNRTGDRNYELHGDILNSSAMDIVFSENGTYLLPQAFPEGSPTHPSFPAGHATIAGACTTVLKAYFNEGFILDEPVEANHTGDTLLPYLGENLTVGNELNKLANNISLGRDTAGVHYRQDGIQGLVAGEQQAISLLREESISLNESSFDGFYLSTFSGESINIKNGRVIKRGFNS